MPPYGLYSLANTPEELLSRGYGTTYNDMYDPAFGQLRSDNLYASAPFTGSIPFQNINRLTGYYDPVDIPSFGGISGYRNVGGIDTLPELDISRFKGMDLESGYLDRAGSSDQDIYAEQVESLTDKKKSNNGILDLALSFAIPGWSILKSLGDGKTYEKFSPGGTIKDGFYKIDDVYTPLTIANDVYDPETGKNRFDRMKDKFHKTRNLMDLFGASRTGSEFMNAKNILKAQKKSGYQSNFMDRPKSERNYTGPGGGDNTGGDVGSKGAADTFSNKSGMGRTGY